MCENPMILHVEKHGYPTQEYCTCGKALEGNAKTCDKCKDAHENNLDERVEE